MEFSCLDYAEKTVIGIITDSSIFLFHYLLMELGGGGGKSWDFFCSIFVTHFFYFLSVLYWFVQCHQQLVSMILYAIYDLHVCSLVITQSD